MILILHEEIEQARYGLLLTRGLAVMFLMAVFLMMMFMTVVMFLVTVFLMMFGRLLSAVGMRRFTAPIPARGLSKGAYMRLTLSIASCSREFRGILSHLWS